jgi:hypothetical protein
LVFLRSPIIYVYILSWFGQKLKSLKSKTGNWF